MRCIDRFRRLQKTDVGLLLSRPSGDFSHFLARLFDTNEAQTIS